MAIGVQLIQFKLEIRGETFLVPVIIFQYGNKKYMLKLIVYKVRELENSFHVNIVLNVS